MTTTVKDTLALVTPSEGQSPPSLPTGWAIPTSTGSQLEVRAARAFTPDVWGLLLPTMSASFRRIEYTFIDGAQTAGQVVWGFPLEVLAFGTSTNSIIASFVNGTTGQAEIRFSNTGTTRTLTLRNLVATGNTVTGSAAYSINTKYRLELSITFGGNLELRTYLWGSDTLIEAITCSAASITQVTKAYVGLNAASAGWSAGYGMPKYADGWIGAAAWNTLTSVTSTRSTTWNVAAALTSVTSTRSTTWNVAKLFNFPVTYPVRAAHRMGVPQPEETLEAAASTRALDPAAALEFDLQDTASVNKVLAHDSTADRTADPSSPITTGDFSTMTATQVRSIIESPQAAGGSTAHMITDDDLAAVYNPSNPVLLLPEIKTTADAASCISRMKSFGWASMCIVQSFSYSFCQLAVAAGFEVVFEMVSGDSHTWAQMKADGINHVMRNKTLWTTTDITAAKAAGLRTWIFTVDTKTEWDTWVANGIDGGVISSNPWLLVATTPVTSTRSTTWNVKAAVAPSTRSTTWRVLASVTSTRTTTWNVLAVVAASTRSTTWNVRSQVAASTRTTTWNVRTASPPSTRSTTWNVNAAVTSSRSTSWNVAGVLTSVTSTRATTWRVIASVAPSSRATTWRVLAPVTSTRSTTWNVTSSVSPTGRAKVWNGTSWVIKPVKVWSGSAWVTKSLKVRSASNTWV